MNVSVTIEEGVARVLLDSPPFNLLSNKVKKEIKETFELLAKNNKVRVILFEAAGEHFCCGANLKEFPDRIKYKKARDAWIDGHDMLNAIMNIPQPTIACMKGNVLGGGAELASAFDIRIFADNVLFGYPEVTKGVFPGNGGFERFHEIAGLAHAAYLFLTGEKINAQNALQMGIANKVVPLCDLEKHGEYTAKLLANHPNAAIQTIKKALNNFQHTSTFYDKGMHLFESIHETEDVNEAVEAFLEKRKPVFKHR